MKPVRLIAAALIFAAVFAVSAYAQPAANVKVMFIDTEAFGTTGGITRYINAKSAVDGDFAPARQELRTMMARHDTLAKEVTQIQTQINAAAPNAPTTSALVRQLDAKIEEGRTLELDIKRRQEDEKTRYGRRYDILVTPVLADIRLALQDFAKQRGYTVILDVSKLGAALVAFDAAKADVTKEFITFYNARPPAVKP